ncbi:hypothetical protein AN694_0223060 [Serratia marcescens]|uniref:Uncharacterized protein n=1 Tax=Serratia marcescens TaxID=615 RepID=A0A2F0PGB6_SERMA|nr:hypothetical protein AN694_0223060 [Serratia marcescens]OCO83141.1 hypothetical protein AN695_0220140 [Serratia marcescens]
MEKENDAGEIDHIPMLKPFIVFSVEQIDSLLLTTGAVSSAETFEPLLEAENLFRSSDANIIKKGQNAFSEPQSARLGLLELHFF